MLMPSTIPQYQAIQQGGPFVLARVPNPEPASKCKVLAGLGTRDGRNANGAVFGPVSTVLILGGGSAVGSCGVQLQRLALPEGSILLATAPPAQHGRLIALGAADALDRSLPSEQLAQQVRMHCPKGADGILDAVAAAAGGRGESGYSPVFGLLRPDGPKKYGQVFTGEKVAVPEGRGIDAKVLFGRQTFTVPGGQMAMVMLSEMSEMGEYQLTVPVEIVGAGPEAIAGGLEKIGRGQVGGGEVGCFDLAWGLLSVGLLKTTLKVRVLRGERYSLTPGDALGSGFARRMDEASYEIIDEPIYAPTPPRSSEHRGDQQKFKHQLHKESQATHSSKFHTPALGGSRGITPKNLKSSSHRRARTQKLTSIRDWRKRKLGTR
ncbi:hypothetical protein MKZ38_008094 [Zalerion maritima]|uniref:Uncharacterized protein n=1 Tax=Zalerion maritima TaxID=339359 RepID=A0AAD5RVJ9_9PEZI|nr:hypothetical protein MKZ38_008094 [Zalerion maritima]